MLLITLIGMALTEARPEARPRKSQVRAEELSATALPLQERLLLGAA